LGASKNGEDIYRRKSIDEFTYMKYSLVDVEIRRVKVYSNQIDSLMMIIGGQIRIIARSIVDCIRRIYLSHSNHLNKSIVLLK
jgi:hypothetical protein